MFDEVNEWAYTCEALHKDKAVSYATKQAEQMREQNCPEAADFWSKVALVVEKRRCSTQVNH